MSEKKGGMVYALAALVIGVAAVPAAAFVNIGLGLVLMSLPIFLVYMAS